MSDILFEMLLSELRVLVCGLPGESLGDALATVAALDSRLFCATPVEDLGENVVRPKATCGFIGLAFNGEALMPLERGAEGNER